MCPSIGAISYPQIVQVSAAVSVASPLETCGSIVSAEPQTSHLCQCESLSNVHDVR